jgi:tetratricopeptide (TPR) repeat protein
LLSEEVANQRRNLMWARSAAATLAVLAGLAVWEAVQAARSRDVARDQRDRAQRVLDQIMASANSRVVSMTERAQEAARTQLEIADTATRGESSRVSLTDALPEIVRAARLLDLAEGYLEREDPTAALKAAETALAQLQTWNGSQDELSNRDLTRARAFELAGLAAARLGRPERARRELAQSLELLKGLATTAPDNAGLQARTAFVMQHVGDIAVKLERWEEAEQHYAGALVLRARAAAASAAVEARRALAVVHNRLANLEFARGRYDAALEANRRARAIIEPLVTGTSDSELRRDLATSDHLAADILKAAGKPEAALSALDRDLAIVQPLAESAPGHAPWQHDLATTWAKLARLYDELGRTQPALEAYDKSISIGEALRAEHRSRPEWLRDLGAALELKSALLTKLGRSREAILALRRSLAVREQVAASSPDEAWQRELEQAYRRTREVLLRSNHTAEALETAEQQLFATSLAADDAPGKNERVARALGSLSWTALFAHDPKRAVWAAEQALVLAPQLEFARINHAHALMFAGDATGARRIYLDGLKAGGAAAAQWREAIKKDFAELSQRGLQNPQMREIEKEIEQ